MKLFLRDIFINGTCFFLIPVFIIVFFPIPYELQDYRYTIIDKTSLLKTIESPRLIIVGGSGAALGIDSKRIMDSLGIPVINTGIEGGVGLKYMMDNAVRYVKPKDIFLLIPEYDLFSENDYLGMSQTLTSILHYPPNLKLINSRQWLHLITYIPEFIKLNFIQKSKLLVYGKNRFKIDYLRKGYNEYGDAHSSLLKRTHPRLKCDEIDIQFNQDIITMLLNYQSLIESKNAKLLVAFPTLCKASYLKSYPLIKRIEDQLVANFEVIDRAEDNILPIKYFKDSKYHLLETGVDVKTRKLIALLEKVINKKTLQIEMN